MNAVVFDIETVPYDEDSFSKEEWEYILKYVENEEEIEQTKERLSLWAFTAHIASLAMLDVSENRALVMYLSDGSGDRDKEDLEFNGVSVHMRAFSTAEGVEEAERRILSVFWEKAEERNGQRFVSFNGRRFDSVFLMLRSFILGVRVTRDLLGNRYKYENHFDLLDALTFHGQGRKYSLDFVCRRLGIPSPKEDFDGKDVKELYREGRYRDIALYNLGDVLATAEIYRRFYDTLGGVFNL
ncbi:ribonuclease H-like domain-containing protein [Hydrogenivirga sp.]